MYLDLDAPLSFEDLKNVLPEVNVLTYKELPNDLQSLIALLPLIILYKNTSNSGHYVCLFQNKEGICFFDPYGKDKKTKKWMKPDAQIEVWKGGFGKYSGKPKLDKLLYEAHSKHGIPVYANDIPYQIYDPLIATCGYHCLLRIIFSNLSESEYKKFIMGHSKKLRMIPDQLVVYLLKKYL